MKKLLFILSLICFIYSCKKAQEPINTLALLQGKWYTQRDTISNYLNGQLIATTPGSADTSQYIQFNSNGTGVLNQGTFTYSLSGNIITLNVAESTYVGNGGILISPAQTYIATIKTLTAKNLELLYDMSLNNNGSIMRATTTAYYIKN